MSEKLPGWPEPGGFEFDERSALLAANDLLRKRAAYWEERCRVAVAALGKFTRHNECDDCWYSCATICCDDGRKGDPCDCGAQLAIDALALIGPLPEGK